MRKAHIIIGLVTLAIASGLKAQVMPEVNVTAKASTYDPRRDDTAAKIVVSNEELVKYGEVIRTAQRQIQAGYGGDASERTPRATLLLADKDGNFS